MEFHVVLRAAGRKARPPGRSCEHNVRGAVIGSESPRYLPALPSRGPLVRVLKSLRTGSLSSCRGFCSQASQHASGRSKRRQRWDWLVDVAVSAAPLSVVAIAARTLFWPTLYYNRWRYGKRNSGSKTQWYNEVSEGVILGALPDDELVKTLARENNVSCVVNMVAEWEGPTDTYERLGIDQLWLRVVDFTAPSVEDLEAAVQWIQERVSAGKCVYIHCKAGKGRSASVVLAYLAATEGISAVEAQQRILDKRPQVLTSLHLRPEVVEFCARRRVKS